MNKPLNVKITNELKTPSETGRHYRLLCMTGPNKGKVYYLIGKRVIIGRGDDADIQIVDVKISREHAELSFFENDYTITDLGAQNGVVVGDVKVKQKKLEDSEKIVIGQTVFKYNVYDVMLDINQLAKQKVQIKSNKIDQTNGKSNTPEAVKKSSSKVIVFGIIILAVLYVLFDNGDAPRPRNANPATNINDFEKELVPLSSKSNQEDAESKRKLENYIHSGRREFGEGNYFRAMEDFRLALLISPTNGHASFYLSKAKQSLDDDINKNFLKGKQEYESKKLQAAIVSYCGVIQLIQNYPNDERYKNALLKISAIEAELGLEKGEVKCFEEKSTESKN